MKAITTTLRDMIVLAVLGVGIALTNNAVRGKANVKLTHPYFEQAAPRKVPPDTSRTSQREDPIVPIVSQGGTKNVVDMLAGKSDRPLEHGYKSVTFREVVAIYDDAGTDAGANIFVDARNDDSYEDGHIPGALQVYHFELARYIDHVMPIAEGADIVIVYCNGGDCEDSGLVCADLNDAGISYDSLYLFKGGWEEWTANGMSVETGRTFDIGEE